MKKEKKRNIYLLIFSLLISLIKSNTLVTQKLSMENVELICKKYNSTSVMKFKFLNQDFVNLNEYINSKKISNFELMYLLKGEKIIIYNHNTLPIRQETHINTNTMEMKTGLFTNRYPLISKGSCKREIDR